MFGSVRRRHVSERAHCWPSICVVCLNTSDLRKMRMPRETTSFAPRALRQCLSRSERVARSAGSLAGISRNGIATVRLFSTAAAAHWMDSKFAAPKPFANAPSHRAPSQQQQQQQRSSHSVVPVSSWFLLDYGHRFYFSFFLN